MRPSRLRTEVVVGISLAGGAIFLAFACIVIFLLRALAQKKRRLADLEYRDFPTQDAGVRQLEPSGSARPRMVLRRSAQQSPYHSGNGWGSLSSRDNVHQPPLALRLPSQVFRDTKLGGKRARSLVMSLKPALPGRFKSLRRLNPARLSVTERGSMALVSVESMHPPPAVGCYGDILDGSVKSGALRTQAGRSSTYNGDQRPASRSEYGSGLQSIQVPKPLVVRKHGTEQEDVAVRQRTQRSKSIATTTRPTPSGVVARDNFRHGRPQMHARSISLCSQYVGIVPIAAAPPIPALLAYDDRYRNGRTQYNISPSRRSLSSFGSGGSSILKTGNSPSYSRGYTGSLHLAADGGWQQLSDAPARAIRDSMAIRGTARLHRPQMSIRSSIARYSADSQPSQDVSRTNSTSSVIHNVLPQRTSLGNSPDGKHGRGLSPSSIPNYRYPNRQSLSTPRRSSRSRVSAYGSPAERRKTSILRDVSGNQTTPTRQTSQHSTQASSTRSSNGNPFQWDPETMQSGKPSALKGSPSARKGHRRQNCVRISLPHTTIRPRSSSPNPSMMNGIKEESPETVLSIRETASVDNGPNSFRALPRPPSASTFAPDVRFSHSMLRASLTQGSPTLSLVDYYPETTSQSTQLNRLSIQSSQTRLSSARHSRSSSIFNIPIFPLPDSALAVETPILSLSRPSTELDEERSLSPIGIRQNEGTMASPTESPVKDTLDGRFKVQHFLTTEDDYSGKDESSQVLLETGSNIATSRPVSPVDVSAAISLFELGNVSNTSKCQPISPPCSPKSLQPSTFLSPRGSSDLSKQIHEATVSETCSSEFRNSTPDSPGQSSLSPLFGPRLEPAKSMQKTILALRRMNSDVVPLTQENRRYLRMGRESSPALSGFNDKEAEEWGEYESARPAQEQAGQSTTIAACDVPFERAKTPVSPSAGRSSSVWEDGENFWQLVEGQHSATNNSDMPVKRHLTTPKVRIQAPSSQVTPVSLYDYKGFLKPEDIL